jgi:putative heme-binding domain-containing protein
VSLPWYEPTRCYHVVPGGHHGWLSPQRADTWRLPPYFFDVVPPVATLGRGSPTGVVCYKHTQFPPRYRGGLFLLDWTFGQIHFLPLKRSGSSYTGTPEVFLRASGDNGFAPTAAVVHPLCGDLYVSIGGRGTRGAVYRIRYPAGLPGVRPAEVAKLQPAPSLAWHAGDQEELLRRAAGPDLFLRRRALDAIRRHRAHFSTAQLERAVRANAGQADRLLRQAAARLLGDLDAKEQDRIIGLLKSPLEQTTAALARPNAGVARLLAEHGLAVAVRLDAVRLLQRCLGGLGARSARGTVWEGYTRRQAKPDLPDRTLAEVRAAFPSGDVNLDRELARTLALVEDEDAATLRKTAGFLTPRSHPSEDVHYLIVLARLHGPRPAAVSKRVAEALLALDVKLAARKLNTDSNWPRRLAELHAGLAARDGRLNEALLRHPDFGRPDHALFARCPGFDRRRAAAVFLKRAAKDGEFAWNAELVRLVGALPSERALPALRRLWGERGLDEEVLAVLARLPQEEDRARFRTGLGSARLATVRRSLDALDALALPAAGRADETLALVRALRQLPARGATKEEERLRGGLEGRLRRLTGQKLAGVAAWVKWFRTAHPERAARLAEADGVDVAGWQKRLAKVSWSAGDAGRGRAVYVKASCASCHSGAQALGPDLRGVTGRFSRDDLFTAIVQPSKDVSPRYRTTLLTTAGGKVYQGLVVYEAVDSVILQTGPATTVRLAHKQISERRLTATSLMPAGLLDRLSDRDIADLYAYLRSLSGPKPP